MPARRQIVRTCQPRPHRAFDQQFWPIFMAMCITASILAATITTLLAGFWMWLSLMILPAAVAVLLLLLRCVDDRRIRRSLQLAVILSLAAHCVFLILAQRTSVFHGLLEEAARETAPLRPQRVIQISQQTETRPWTEVLPTSTPAPETPEPERDRETENSPVARQPTPLENTTPSEHPQPVQRQQVTPTVPRMGQSLSRLSRQSPNLQPRSRQAVTVAQPAAPAQSSPRNQPRPDASEILKSSAAADSTAPQPDRREQRVETTSTGALTRATEREQPAAATAARPASQTPRPRSASRPQIARTSSVPPSAAPRRPESPATSAPSAADQPLNRQPSTSLANRNPESENRPRSRISENRNRRPARDNQTRPAIDRQLVAERPAQSPNRAIQPHSPAVAERPAPAARPTPAPASSRMQPSRLAVKKSTGGTAGAGRAANMDRQLGSTRSPATVPANSLNRRERTTVVADPSALTLQQAAQVPTARAAQVRPGSTVPPDRVAIANRSASQNRAELTASSSAALNQSNSQATEAETSVERGSGSVDLGSTRIVTEIAGQRVEGGGQPEISSNLSEVRDAQTGETGSTVPSLASPDQQPQVADDRLLSGDSRLADRPVADAQSALNSRAGNPAPEAGSPDRTPRDPGQNPASQLSDSTLQRSPGQGDTDDQDGEPSGGGELAGPAAGRSTATDDPVTPGTEMNPRTGLPAIADQTGTGSSPVPAVVKVADERSGKTGRSGATAGAQRPGRAMGQDARVASNPRLQGGGGRRQSKTEPSLQQGPRPAELAGEPRTAPRVPGTVPIPQPAGQVAAARGLANQVNPAENRQPLDRPSPAGINLAIEARPGPAGISDRPEPDVGIESRRAWRDSPAIQSMMDTRFRRTESGGTPSINSSPTMAREAFRGRSMPGQSAPRTEASIELGLAFLARHQQSDGSWELGGFGMDQSDRAKMISSDTAATGLALLAFQGAGYHHREFKYASRLQTAIDWLVENQTADGELFVAADDNSNQFARMYSHGIATIALAEAYGMTQDESLRVPVQRALDYIANTQDPDLGGWRYRPGRGTDTSVSGWMLMALHSGRLAGFDVDPDTLEGVRRWLDMAVDARQPHQFRYNPQGEDTARFQRSLGRIPTPCMTAVGLLMHLYMEQDTSDPRLAAGAGYLLQHLPDDSTPESRDTYYWYYATQLLKHQGGPAWQTWYQALHPQLVNTQIKQGELAGSWHPLEPVPDKWGAHGGRIYVTTMNLLSLEVEYRLLPLYDEPGRQ